MRPEFAPIAFISAFSVLLVVPWHWRARNAATLSMAAWLFITNTIYAIDAVVWSGNVKIVIPVWCDITTKIIIGSQFALPAACLCISIHLERVASVRAARIMQQDRRRRQIFEGIMCWGLPAVFMALHYIVQGHRFDVIEDYGCRPTTYISYVGIFLMYFPPLFMALVSFVFSALALRHFLRRRVTFALHLQASNSALTTSRYFRLMSMALAQMFAIVAVTAYTLWFTLIAVPIRPYTSWADVHSDWSRIDQYLTKFTPPLVVRSFYALWWMVPLSTFLFVAFFAFGQEALDEYRKCCMWLVSVFRSKSALSEKLNPKGSLLDRIPAKFTLPLFLGGSKDTTNSSTTDSSLTIPQYYYPQPPPPPKYLPDTPIDSSFSDSSSNYASDPKPTSPVDQEAHPLPPLTPFSCGSTSRMGVESKPSSLRSPIFSPSPTPDPSNVETSPFPPPPPSRPRVRPIIPASEPQEPSSPRPLTYPSADAWHRSIAITFPSS
nr:pheromone receptor B4 [Pleurotus eryngii]